MKTLPKRTTVYFDRQLHSALTFKAAQTEQSLPNKDCIREEILTNTGMP